MVRYVNRRSWVGGVLAGSALACFYIKALVVALLHVLALAWMDVYKYGAHHYMCKYVRTTMLGEKAKEKN